MKNKIISSSIEKGISKSDWFTLKHVGNIKQTFFFFWYSNHHTISAKKFTITGTLEKNTVLFKIDLADFSIRQMNLHSIINAWQILFFNIQEDNIRIKFWFCKLLFEDCELFAIYLIIRYAAFMFVNCQWKKGLHGTPTIFMVVINCFVQLSK